MQINKAKKAASEFINHVFEANYEAVWKSITKESQGFLLGVIFSTVILKNTDCTLPPRIFRACTNREYPGYSKDTIKALVEWAINNIKEIPKELLLDRAIKATNKAGKIDLIEILVVGNPIT